MHLLLDMSYLAWTEFHAKKKEIENGSEVLQAVFDRIRSLLIEFDSCRALFAFDARTSLRKEVFPGYKSSRDAEVIPDEERRLKGELREAMFGLPRVLHRAGLCAARLPGYEADDLLAEAAAVLTAEGRDGAVVTADEDLLQCLSEHVVLLTPSRKAQRIRTAAWFRAEYNLDPCRWAHVLAIAGCDTDDIPGVPGVGKITAAKYLSGRLNPTTQAYGKIRSDLSGAQSRLPLVQLPYAGTHLPFDWLESARGVTDVKLKRVYTALEFVWGDM